MRQNINGSFFLIDNEATLQLYKHFEGFWNLVFSPWETYFNFA